MTTSTVTTMVLLALVSISGVVPNPHDSRMRRQLSQSPQTTPEPAPGVVYLIPNCDCQTTPEYNPVCGSNGVTYQNRQKLECAASCGTDVRLRRSGTCGRSLQKVMEQRRS